MCVDLGAVEVEMRDRACRAEPEQPLLELEERREPVEMTWRIRIWSLNPYDATV